MSGRTKAEALKKAAEEFGVSPDKIDLGELLPLPHDGKPRGQARAGSARAGQAER